MTAPRLHVLPEGPTKYLTVDVKTLQENQRLHREVRGGFSMGKPPCWIQIEDDKQNKINCWDVTFVANKPGDFGIMKYGHPRICGAMVYVETTAELEYLA